MKWLMVRVFHRGEDAWSRKARGLKSLFPEARIERYPAINSSNVLIPVTVQAGRTEI
ncbi:MULTISPECIES: hypothetical protein [Desulfofundulus]|uniref:hypothetical protein n=1 Tax=Desulfofundulus TaxID=2282741 RepID=UPI0012FE87D6|nr:MULTISPECIES: hypothetical protein [Desulfofundulus]